MSTNIDYSSLTLTNYRTLIPKQGFNEVYNPSKPSEIIGYVNHFGKLTSINEVLENIKEWEGVAYRLVKTMGRKIEEPSLIDEIDASSIPLIELAQVYYDIYFIIRSKYHKQDKVLYFTDLPLSVQISEDSISEYLKKNKTKTINRLGDELPEHVRGEVYSWDVHSWDFLYRSIQYGANPNARILEEDREDLYLYRAKEGYDYATAVKHSLISINGLFHYFEPMNKGWVLFGGNKTKNKRKDSTHINILDFTQVGEVKMKRITEKMIRAGNDIAPLNEAVYIDVGESLRNKTVGIVIGGYLHLLDHTYKRISERIIKVNFNNISWETLYYKMKDIIDVSSLSITDFGDDRTIGFELYHDTVIKQLFTLPQSFLVIIDNPAIAIYEEPVGDMGIPHRYETGLLPIYPLRLGEGRYPAYKANKNLDKWVLSVDDNIVPLQVRYQKQQDKFNMIHNRIYPINGETYARAHFMRIVSDRDLKVRNIDDIVENAIKDLGSLKPFMLKMDIGSIEYQKDDKRKYYLPKKIVDVDFDNDAYYTELDPRPWTFNGYKTED